MLQGSLKLPPHVTLLQDLQEESGSLADVLKAGLQKAPEDDQLAFGGPRYQATDPNSQVSHAVIILPLLPCHGSQQTGT